MPPEEAVLLEEVVWLYPGKKYFLFGTSVMNPDPGWIPIQMGQWIRILKEQFFVQENKEMLCFDKLEFFH